MKTDKFWELIEDIKRKHSLDLKVVEYKDNDNVGYKMFFDDDYYIDVKDKSKMCLYNRVCCYFRLPYFLWLLPSKKGTVLHLTEERQNPFCIDKVKVHFKKDYFEREELEKRIKEIYSDHPNGISTELHPFLEPRQIIQKRRKRNSKAIQRCVSNKDKSIEAKNELL